MRILALVALAVTCTFAGAAEMTPNGFIVKQERMINAPPARVYESIVGQIGAWWNPQHTYSGDSKNLSIDARAGGCFCERLSNGGVEHMRVVYLQANDTIRLSGALGPLQGSGLAGAMTWRVSSTGAATKLELMYVVGGFMPGGFETMGPAVERVLSDQVDRLKRFIETGAPGETKAS